MAIWKNMRRRRREKEEDGVKDRKTEREEKVPPSLSQEEARLAAIRSVILGARDRRETA